MKNEGVTALYAGLSAALARQASYTTLRLGLYDLLWRLVLDSSEADVVGCRGFPQNMLLQLVLQTTCSRRSFFGHLFLSSRHHTFPLSRPLFRATTCRGAVLTRDNRHEWRAAVAFAYSYRRRLGGHGVLLLLSDRGLPCQDAGDDGPFSVLGHADLKDFPPTLTNPHFLFRAVSTCANCIRSVQVCPTLLSVVLPHTYPM